jgi:hypothetical protein
MRLIVIAVLLALSVITPTHAQPTTKDCISATCQLVTGPDNVAGTQPTQCRLYSGTTALETVAVGGTASARTCTFTARNFAAGAHTLTAKFLDASGNESQPSNTVMLTSQPAAIQQPPTNLRFL